MFLNYLGILPIYAKHTKEEMLMQDKNVLEQIREEVREHEGERVLVSARRARRGFAVNRGVLEATYPSIFTITTDDDSDGRLSFSYSEILTRNVILEWESR
jgi:uncharacterized protein Veg